MTVSVTALRPIFSFNPSAQEYSPSFAAWTRQSSLSPTATPFRPFCSPIPEPQGGSYERLRIALLIRAESSAFFDGVDSEDYHALAPTPPLLPLRTVPQAFRSISPLRLSAAASPPLSPSNSLTKVDSHTSTTQQLRSIKMAANQSPAVTPAKKQQQYYAGPAFANSPAASSLPVPKLFLRQEAARAAGAGDSPRSANASPAMGVATPSKKTLSGLDMLFDADRKEKATPQRPAELDSTPPRPSRTPQQAETPPLTRTLYKDGHLQDVTEDEYLAHQTQLLKDLLFIGKPSTPNTSSARPQQQPMSAPPQYNGMPGPSYHATPQYGDGPPSDLYYGNRHLTQQFAAIRQSQQQQPRTDQLQPPNQSMAPLAPTTLTTAQKEDAVRRMIGLS